MRHPLGPGEHRISQRFGERPEYYRPLGYDGHEGLDFPCASGTPVYAAHAGVVRWLPYSAGYQRYMRVENDEISTTYAHLSAYVARDGENVVAGQLIALSGGDHLHWGVRAKPEDWTNGYQGYVDPEPYLLEVSMPSKLGVQVQDCSSLGGPGSWVIDHVRRGKVRQALLINPDVLSADPWPGVETMGRLTFPGDPDQAMIRLGAEGAAMYVALCAPRWVRCPWIRLWQGPNEPYTGDPNDHNDLEPMRRIAEFYIALALLMHQRGLLCGGPVFGTGQPAGPPASPIAAIEAKWRILGPACDVLDALVVHEYGMDTLDPTPENEWHVGAYRRGVAVLLAAGRKVPPIWVAEHGIDRAGDPDTDGWRAKLGGDEAKYMRQLAARDAEYSTDPHVACVLLFVWLDYNWPSFTLIKSMSERVVQHRLAMGAAPVEPPVVVEPSTALVNPSFEDDVPYVEYPFGYVAPGWSPFFYETADHLRDGDETGEYGPHYNFVPEFKGSEGLLYPNRIHGGGRQAQQTFKQFGHHRSGVRQRVRVKGLVRFSAWFSAWCSQADDPMHSWDKAIEAPDGEAIKAPDAKPGRFFGKVGIDPTGGTDPWAATVIWGEPVTECDVWSQASVTAECDGVVTVFVCAEPEWPFKHTDCYADDCTLVIEGALPDELVGWLDQVPATIKAVAERGYTPLGMERVASEGGYWGLGYRDGRYGAVRVEITATGLEFAEERDLGGKQVRED